MNVRVIRLFRRGAPIPRDRLGVPVAGTLQTFILEGRLTASLTVNPSLPQQVLPRLIYPVLMSAGHGRMRLRGFEEDEGRLYAQDWICEVA
jgi:hypothetical protein